MDSSAIHGEGKNHPAVSEPIKSDLVADLKAIAADTNAKSTSEDEVVVLHDVAGQETEEQVASKEAALAAYADAEVAKLRAQARGNDQEARAEEVEQAEPSLEEIKSTTEAKLDSLITQIDLMGTETSPVGANKLRDINDEFYEAMLRLAKDGLQNPDARDDALAWLREKARQLSSEAGIYGEKFGRSKKSLSEAEGPMHYGFAAMERDDSNSSARAIAADMAGRFSAQLKAGLGILNETPKDLGSTQTIYEQITDGLLIRLEQARADKSIDKLRDETWLATRRLDALATTLHEQLVAINTAASQADVDFKAKMKNKMV